MNRQEQDNSEYGRTGRVNGGGESHEPRVSEPAPVREVDASLVGMQAGKSRLGSVIARSALALFAGLCLTLIQLMIVLSFAPDDEGVPGRYASLVQHDSFWFENIMARGYGSPVPPAPYKSFEVSNVAFFPGYPLLAGWIQQRWDLEPRNALLLAAQLSAWLVWSYAAAFMMRWRVPWPVGAAILIVIAAHPAAFFMVAAYSESLFLAALLGFLFWSSRPGKAAALLAAAHGFCMTATRIVGIPCAAAAGGGEGGILRRLERRFWILFVSVLGAVLFFAFCQARFGSWDFYMQTQKAGWGVTPDYLEPLRWSHYSLLTPDWEAPREVSRFSMAVTLWLAAGMALAELAALWQARRRGIGSGFRERLPFYFCAAAIFYVSAAGVASVGFESMIRYQFCTYALGALAAAHLLAKVPPQSVMVRGAFWVAAALLTAAGWWLQGYYAAVFTRGGWFA